MIFATCQLRKNSLNTLWKRLACAPCYSSFVGVPRLWKFALCEKGTKYWLGWLSNDSWSPSCTTRSSFWALCALLCEPGTPSWDLFCECFLFSLLHFFFPGKTFFLDPPSMNEQVGRLCSLDRSPEDPRINGWIFAESRSFLQAQWTPSDLLLWHAGAAADPSAFPKMAALYV